MSKKAFVLARQVPEYQSLAQRVRSIFFLATPHRGSDLAPTLSKILAVASGARPFVQDLHPNSIITESINDEFPQHCQGLQLYSFYETVATNYGYGKGLVVDKDSAVLGYSNERTSYLNANHREVCKYASRTDPNYLTVRNALANIVADLRDLHGPTKSVLDHDQQRVLDGFIGISDAPEDDFMGVDSKRMRGSCEWLMEKKSFRMWRDSSASQMYWISAKPATGKSVLSGYVVKHFKERNLDCVFYFFAHGDKAKSSISFFLRSMAWQMASMHPEILQMVLDICEKDDRLCQSQMDYRTIWRKLFLDGILKVKLERCQYWVIDGVDESKGDTATDLTSFLLKIIETSHINILVTSRNKFEPPRLMTISKSKVISEEISAEDTLSDISLYLQANMEDLPLVEEDARRNMVTTILKKSAGCFLWVSLVLQELRQVNTAAEIRRVLEEVPSDMDALYSRILDTMSRAPYGKVLAKAILTWTVCSARPLTTDELYHALQIDIKDKIGNVEKCIASCGHLVFVDGQSRVQMVHLTAREFLLHPTTNSEFAIDRKLGHKQLAMACLEYLNGNEMKGPRHRKLSVSLVVRERCSFVAYACNCLFEHIGHVSSTDDDFLLKLAKFLSGSNVLSWIEYIAQHSDLNRLIQTGKALKNLLQRRSKHMFPFGKEVKTINSWATDLIRLVAKFGNHLANYPSSIFHLIPPFCPPETAPRSQFASSTRGIAVLGLSNTTWDDCLSTIFHQHQQLSALDCSSKYFAVGLSRGTVQVYYETTCQEAHKLDHRECVKILKFGDTGQYLASGGLKFVRVWDTSTWEETWTFDIAALCMSLAFTDSDRILLGALKNNRLMFWDLTTGTMQDPTDWTSDLEGQRALAFRRPTLAEFCMDQSLLAVVYRGQDILLWDLERDSMFATFAKESPDGIRLKNTTVVALAFSNAPDANILAVSYWDGDLVLFDTSEGSIGSMKETVFANAQILVSSPDGRTLATGGNAGKIQLFDFETLKLLYRISSDTDDIKSLAFSGDSHRLLDIRGSQCRIWDPVVLARQDADDETSDTVSVSTAPQEFRLNNPDEIVLITALACHESGEIFFCGKEDGSVWQYEVKSGRPAKRLFGHVEGVSVVSLCYENTFLSSTDSSSRVMTHKLDRQQMGYSASQLIFVHRTEYAVHQLLSNTEHTKLLISTSNADTFWSITIGGCETLRTLPQTGERPRRWANHPSNQNRLILFVDNIARIYDWETLEEVTDDQGISLRDVNPGFGIRRIFSCFNDTMFAITLSESQTSRDKPILLLFPLTDFNPSSQEAVPAAAHRHLVNKAERLIGAWGSRLIFLDSSGWICSAEADAVNENINHHFFLPADWLSNNSDLMIEVTGKGDIIFVKRDETAVIKRGLENIEQAPVRPPKHSNTIPSSSSSSLLTVPYPIRP